VFNAFNEVILEGKDFINYKSEKGILFFADIKELVDYLHKKPIIKMNILIKGSRGMHLEKITQYL